MEGVRVFSPDDWDASGVDATSYAAEDLKKCLEGLANHLFGKLRTKTLLSKWTLVTRKYSELWKHWMNLSGKNCKF